MLKIPHQEPRLEPEACHVKAHLDGLQTGRRGDGETGRRGDGETGRQADVNRAYRRIAGTNQHPIRMGTQKSIPHAWGGIKY